MQLTTKLNTVFILVGPSMSGKTTFAAELHKALHRDAAQRGMNYTASILSSDAYRHYLVGDFGADRHTPGMLEVSGQAFEMLFVDLKAITSFPVNHDFVIVDTTGMNERFRDDVREIAKARGYNVELIVFEYKKAEALRGVDPSHHPIVLKQLERMKRDVMPNLKSKAYAARTKISARSPTKWEDLTVDVVDAKDMFPCLLHLETGKGVAIIGDTHEHADALTELLAKLDAIDPTLQKVHVGDYLDKGGNTEAIIQLMAKRVVAGDIIVRGNHEAYVVRRLRGEIEPNPEIEEKYITALKVLFERPDLQQIVFELYDHHSVPFLKISGDNARTLYVTHAPCDEVHLGKLSYDAVKAQRNLYSADRTRDYRLDYGFVFEQANGTGPLHVFGHVAHKAARLDYKNKIFLDTGAVYGNKLTAMVYRDSYYEFVSVDTKRLDTTDKELPADATQPMKVDKPFDIRDYNLDPKEIRFVNNFDKKGAKFISGTMAPAPSTSDKLEGLDAGLDYFRKRGVTEVVMEPKYMGSRCQLYLFRGRPEDGFAVSRNGYVIGRDRVPGLAELIEKETAKFEEWENTGGDAKEVILDGELLPWSALGKGLIDDQFRSYGQLAGWELEQLDVDELRALDFNTKPDHAARYSDLGAFFGTLSLYDKDVGTESNQVPLEFKAFSTLKVDGVECTGEDQAYAFRAVNSDPVLIVNLLTGEGEAEAKAFFDKLTVEQGMEGVVLKPRVPTEGVVPYMKVRNEEYLRLVYGYDYPRRYAALCRQKNISNKTRVSLKEWELGKQMLTAEGDAMKELVVKMIGQLNQEKTLDPRL